LPRSSLLSDGTESAHGGLKEHLQREYTNGRKKTNKPVRRRSTGRWGSIDGNQLMDVEEEIADTLSESGSDDDKDISKNQHFLLHLTTSYSTYFGGKKGISRNKTSFFFY